MRNTTGSYTSCVSTDVDVYEDLLGHHLFAVRNLISTTNEESYHVLTLKFRQPRHVFTFGVGITFIPYPLVLNPLV
jgi:hypothetical protein